MITIDTNILIYTIDPRDTVKQKIAAAAITALRASGNAMLPQKVVEEFLHLCLRRDLLEPGQLTEFVELYSAAFQIVDTSFEDIKQAFQMAKKKQLSFWDAVVFATAKRAGCTIMLSEDGPSDATINDKTWVNPFGPKGLQHTKLKRFLA